ncbi:glycoside hydrolase family 57 protein [Halonatronum saccharophilum]|uniref:glycoside hydrolase family 57 protein n=1 Tax=Halonatronum saccharophilum TaxID=150060 RepID=UPI00047FD74F|nr:1,4-alpha-glucan branching protein domain-containing protein [Halonatronum saccharophilum]
MGSKRGYLAIILHAHLPFIRHPEYDDFMEEQWLYQAITETYIPLINKFEDLYEDGVDYKLTMTLTPTLLSMLTDNLLQERYLRYLDKSIRLSKEEVKRTKENKDFNNLSKYYLNRFKKAKETFIAYDKDITNAFKKFSKLGFLKIITCGATHGYLPLMQEHPEAVKAQIEVAVGLHKRILGEDPKGIWLPECAYYKGLDKILKEYGIEFFALDSHGLLYGKPRPEYGVFAPISTESGVAVFGREQKSGRQVWSSKVGYPGDYVYREFYRDIGFDLPLDYIGPYIHPDGIRRDTGIKYYKITNDNGDLNKKSVYDHKEAKLKAEEHAQHFIDERIIQLKDLEGLIDRNPIFVAPYDAELFGHWWYEGPEFLDFLIRRLGEEEDLSLVSPLDYLEFYPTNQISQPSSSSWGAKGYNDIWLEESNDWIYPYLHKMAEKMIELATDISDPSDLNRRALNQAARELLLAQSSDWAFIMATGTTVEYARKRVKDHIQNFVHLCQGVEEDDLDKNFLRELEEKNNIFPYINYKVYSQKKSPVIVGKGEDISIKG